MAKNRSAQRLRALNRQPGADYQTFRKGLEHPDPAIAANVIIGLIKVASCLLYRQLKYLEKEFLAQGGLREKMTRARLDYRSAHPEPPPKVPRKS